MAARAADHPADRATESSGTGTLMVLGDSLSAAHNIPAASGWVSLLAQRLKPLAWEVVNASISGETSGGGAARVGELLQRHQPRLLLVELGGNDGLRGLPVSQLRDNLSTIIQQALAVDAQVLLVEIQIPSNYGPLYRRRFEAIYTELAQSFHVPLVPFLLENIALNPELMQSDGIHPTAAAQSLIVDHVWPHLEPYLNPGSAPKERRQGSNP